MNNAKDYRLTIKVRNNRILKAIEAIGGEPGGKWCEKNGLSYVSVNDLISMKASPIAASGNLSTTALKLCEVLGKLPEELWSNEQIYPLEKNFSDVEISHEEMLSLAAPGALSLQSPEDDMEKVNTSRMLTKAVKSLPQKMQDIIRMRFVEDKTYNEIGECLDISGSRVMQLHEKALRRLRHPDNKLSPLREVMEA